jgi:hypothetical protein
MSGNGMACFTSNVSGAKGSCDHSQACLGWQLWQEDLLKSFCGQSIGVRIDQKVFGRFDVLHGLHFLTSPKASILNWCTSAQKWCIKALEFRLLMHVKFANAGMVHAKSSERLFQRVVILTFPNHPLKENT